MEDLKNLLHVAEYIEDRLYFATVTTYATPCSTSTVHFFSVDYELEYESFYSDFGPLNLAKLYRYCCKLNEKLKSRALSKKKIVHYTTHHFKKRVNAAFLIASYAVIYLKKSPSEAYQPLVGYNSPSFIPFRDASFGQCTYYLTLSDCIHAVNKALESGFLDLESFDLEEYEHYEKVENGDLNWIVPNKFLAFCGPHSKSKSENGYPLHAPEFYVGYFRKTNVTTIVRLNKKIYDAQRFINHGFDHRDLYFVDGSTPSDKILHEFLEISESAKGAIAVHCKAGLGRTGTLIACYIMKHNHFTAAEAIAWIRICRPGSVIGNQQQWLEEKQGLLCYQGNVFRADKVDSNSNNRTPTRVTRSSLQKNDDDMPHILSKVDQLYVDDTARCNNNSRSRRERTIKNNLLYSNNNDNNNNKECDEAITQGDKLNRIKAMRRHPRSHTTSGVNLEHLKPNPRSSSQPLKSVTTSSSYISPLKPLRTTESSLSSKEICVNSPSARRKSVRQHTVCSSPTKRCQKNTLLNEKTQTR